MMEYIGFQRRFDIPAVSDVRKIVPINQSVSYVLVWGEEKQFYRHYGDSCRNILLKGNLYRNKSKEVSPTQNAIFISLSLKLKCLYLVHQFNWLWKLNSRWWVLNSEKYSFTVHVSQLWLFDVMFSSLLTVQHVGLVCWTVEKQLC